MYNYTAIIKILQGLLDTEGGLGSGEREAIGYIIDGLEQEKRFHWIRDEVEDLFCLDLDALLRKYNALIMED